MDNDTSLSCNANFKVKRMKQENLPLESTHAELSASSSHRWISCPASVSASRGLADKASEAALEGTAAHELAEECLRSEEQAKDYVGQSFNDHVVDDDMAGFVQVYIDYCRSVASSQTYIEAKLDYSIWADGGYGTADFISIAAGEAYVVDLKYGRMPVEANGSQLKCYALGVLNAYGFDAQIDTVHMVIVQPRLGQIDVHTMRHTELLTWGRDVLMPAAQAALGTNPSYNPGENQCRFCKAAPTCKPLAEHVLKNLSSDFDDLTVSPPDADKLTAADIAKVLPHINLIKAWCEKVAVKAQDLASEGYPIEGYKLVRSKTNRRWSNEQEALQLMQRLTNETVVSNKLISPTQAIKILGVESDELKKLILKPEGRPTLVPVSDRRAEINALEGFQVIEK